LQVQSPDDARQAETKGETWRRRKKLTDPAIDAWCMSQKNKKVEKAKAGYAAASLTGAN